MRKIALVLAGILAIFLIMKTPVVPWAQTRGRTITGIVPAPRKAAQTVFYVATDGKDSWTGKLDKPNAARTDGPFLTVQQAQKAIRDLKASGLLKAPVTVYIRGGRYALAEPLVFTSEDSGTPQDPIT